jgi:hypothetical protein
VAEWPDVARVQRALGATDQSHTQDVQDAIDAAIECIEADTGRTFGSGDAPSVRLSQAALLLAVAGFKAPDAPFGVAAVFDMGGIYVARSNPNYVRLIKGERVRFGLA